MSDRNGAPQRATWTVPEAAAIVGIPTSTYYDLARQGRLPVLKVGRRTYVPKTQLEAFLAGTWQTAS